jgi:hypothetical protein
VSEDSLLERVTAAAEERQLQQNVHANSQRPSRLEGNDFGEIFIRPKTERF